MASWQRTIACGALREEHIGQEVILNGWAHRVRTFGDLVFIDLRDRTGLVQVVVDRSDVPELIETANAIRTEYVLSLRGLVRQRKPGTENPKLATGNVEVAAQQLQILNPSKTLPFPLNDEDQMRSVDETLRVKHRYLDLRRPKMYRVLDLRHRVVKLLRDLLDAEGFLEIETPILTKSTPEGARDYLVPYRLQPGLFYALPQSPQQYKQLLMVAGCERYFQIARCFRDEAQRADRQPEFTQLDVEMSFVTQEDILQLIERLMTAVVQQQSSKKLFASPFPRFTYDEAMRLYGTDKPDIRFDLTLCDLSDLALETDFSVFRSAVEAGGQVKAVRYPGGAQLSRKEQELLAEFVKDFGATGLATIAVSEPNPEGVKSSIAKFFSANQMQRLLETCRAEAGDLLCLVAHSNPKIVAEALSRLRLEIGRRCNLRDPEVLAFCFITDFPLVQWNAEEGRWEAEHHPFTMPYEEHLPFFDTDPARIRAQCYDLVCNGQESASGSIRIHRADIQQKVFDLLGIDRARQQERFGHLLEAFSYGAPPHGGFAAGIDRLIMNLLDEPNIREVIPFPKMGLGYDPMMEAPSEVEETQLLELGLRIIPRENGKKL